jgi:hypothetical protein
MNGNSIASSRFNGNWRGDQEITRGDGTRSIATISIHAGPIDDWFADDFPTWKGAR